MVGTGPRGSRLEDAAGATGPHVTEAFKLLSDETRLAILLALWEGYDPHAEANSISFTRLYERVNVQDSGNFAYHLDKLVGHFVEDTEDGYVLSNAGHKIVRAVIAGSGLQERSLPWTKTPRSCPSCGGTVEVRYADQRLYQRCPSCQGHLGPRSSEQTPTGTLVVHDGFDPAGLVGRSPEEVFVASTIDYHGTVTLVIRRICPECSGTVEETLHLCEDHDPDAGDLCSTCGTGDEARARYVCSVCKFSVSYPAWAAAFDHPAVVAFYYDHGCEGTFDLEDPEAAGRLWDRLIRDQELVSRDPVRIRVDIREAGEVLELTLDGDLNVVEVEGPYEGSKPARAEA